MAKVSITATIEREIEIDGDILEQRFENKVPENMEEWEQLQDASDSCTDSYKGSEISSVTLTMQELKDLPEGEDS